MTLNNIYQLINLKIMAKIVSSMANTAICYRNRRLIAIYEKKVAIHEKKVAIHNELLHELFLLSIMRCCVTPF